METVKDTDSEVETVETLNNILRTLVGSYMHPLYFDTLEQEEEARDKHGLKKKRTKGLSKGEEEEEERKKIMRNYFLRDLFLWSILINRIDMAKVFLSFMSYRICPALIATKILKQYHQAASHGELKTSYKESADYFEQYAIDCLDKSDDHDAAKACEIILQRNELYGYVTCLQVG